MKTVYVASLTMTARHVASLTLAAALSAGAQTPSGAPAAAAGNAPVPPAEQQIAAAVLPLPADLRAGATVMGYAPDGRFVTLREGPGTMTCLASNPTSQRFHVACYHRSLEPFMARGRELRAQGVAGDQVDTVRFREARSGKLKLPKEPAMLYSLTGGTFDPATSTANGARPLFVIYVPFATAESTGLSATPVRGAPWIMQAGTPKAHIMFTPNM
ncbi:MAG: hypothetical protein ABR499_05205 [Gemmatimonadaceae bacterium]